MSYNIQVTSFSLSIEGLTICYLTKGKESTLELAPFPTCELFKTLGIIEHFDTDGNEPVIVEEAHEGYEDEYGQQYRRTGMAWLYWCDFVKEYNFIEAEAKIIAAHHEKDLYYTEVLTKVGLLEKQLKATV